MTGDEHYREAESLIQKYRFSMQMSGGRAEPGFHESMANVLAEAQVHATLALAAATVDTSFVVQQEGDFGTRTVFIDEDRAGWGYGR